MEFLLLLGLGYPVINQPQGCVHHSVETLAPLIYIPDKKSSSRIKDKCIARGSYLLTHSDDASVNL